MRHDSFVAFILTNGRPDKVYTYEVLKRGGYTGKICIVCDDEDKCLDEYKKKFENVLVFSKEEIAKTFDNGDNFKDRRAIIYARNACFSLAKELGVKYFIELDDDYTCMQFRFDDELEFRSANIESLDNMFDLLIDFYNSTNCLSVAMSQGGDFIGGKRNGILKDGIPLKRKCMNSFICSTERPFSFFGRINEDVNVYTNLASRGGLFFTVMLIGLTQKQTQSSSGGMTELYLDGGTYLKSFYSVMYQPSSVHVSVMGTKAKRLHHSVDWRTTVPKIVSEDCKKKTTLKQHKK